MFHWAHFILKSIGGQIIINFHWFLKDDEAVDWRGGFLNFHGTRRTSEKRGLEKLGGEEFLALFFLCDFSWKWGGEG